jgi:Permuted papain-like amidase enzyme, YaeF/YiiX, C92 family
MEINMFDHGDLIFLQIGIADDAIGAVTEGYRGARVNHVGVVLQNNKGISVLQAYYPDVHATKIELFLAQSNDRLGQPRYIHSRLKPEHQQLIPKAIEYGITQYDVPYDLRYLTDENALYCSELVVDMFKSANNGSEFFPEVPMNFRDLATGELHPSWIEYYKRFGMDVPQGSPGSNPGGISKHASLRVISVKGDITGYLAP